MTFGGFEKKEIRRKGKQHEYVAWSMKAGAAVKLYKKSEVLYWLRQEFNPDVSKIIAEHHVFTCEGVKVELPVVGIRNGRETIAYFGSSEDAEAGCLEKHCRIKGIYFDLVNVEELGAFENEYWNLLRMYQCLVKWRRSLPERDLEEISGRLKSGAVMKLSELIGSREKEMAMALVFELLRRGRLRLQNIHAEKLNFESCFIVT